MKGYFVYLSFMYSLNCFSHFRSELEYLEYLRSSLISFLISLKLDSRVMALHSSNIFRKLSFFLATNKSMCSSKSRSRSDFSRLLLTNSYLVKKATFSKNI